MRALVKWTLVAVVLAIGAVVMLTVATMAFVFSIGEAHPSLDVTVAALDKATRQPVPDCLLAFEQGYDGRSDYGRSLARTDAAGRSRHKARHSYGTSMFWPVGERHPTVRFYLGSPPEPGSDRSVETWDVTMRFDEPWSTTGKELRPRTEVRRSLTRDASYVGTYGPRTAVESSPLPVAADDGLASSTLRIDRGGDGQTYRVSLSVYLDRAQAAACQATSQ